MSEVLDPLEVGRQFLRKVYGLVEGPVRRGRRVRNRVACRTAALRLLADWVGLIGALSGMVAGTRLFPVHDRGRVFTDLAVTIADGGTTISGIGTLGDQDELFGVVASVPTAWRR